jgi:hypothetical protein
MKQMNFASTGFQLVSRRTRKREFLDAQGSVEEGQGQASWPKSNTPFRVIKWKFGQSKTRYWRLAKNTSQLAVMFLSCQTCGWFEANIAAAAGLIASAARAEARIMARLGQKNVKSASNSAMVPLCEYSRINSRLRVGLADS